MTEEEKKLDDEITSTLADTVMSFVEEGEDQEIRSSRDKIEAYSEQINELDATIAHMQGVIEQAMESMCDKQRRRAMLNRRCEIERDKLHQLEKLARDHAGQ